MAHEEIESRTELRLARPQEIARLFGRALTLRCPHCGGRPVLRHWLKLRERCPKCGLRLERGEHDYFSGSVLFNFIFSELLFAFVFVVYLIVKHGDVDWDTLQFVLIGMVGLAPIALYAISKLLWLAFDLMLRPVTSEELEWHRSEKREFSTGQPGPAERERR
ncbi:MAG TPA: DUF983 domain-containing protein [Gemmatimonadaceae bacterium]|nr:DUF983 domain-containing protein [Gemmatimonadaceae bacterium]